MIPVGIDDASFQTPLFYLRLEDLATMRGIEPNKYRVGLGQYKMAVPPPDEGIVTMAASAAHRILNEDNRDQIGLVLFATESSIDQSKSAGIYVHQLLNLPKRCRVLELKQACYSATAGLQLALTWLQANPEQKVFAAKTFQCYAETFGRNHVFSQGENQCECLPLKLFSF